MTFSIGSLDLFSNKVFSTRTKHTIPEILNPYIYPSDHKLLGDTVLQTCGLHRYSIEGLSYVPGVTLPGYYDPSLI